jgi:hypothetical protein
MTDEQVWLGAAIMFLKRYGDDAPVMLATRIGELAVEGDAAGLAVWQAVARHMDSILQTGPMQ